MCVHECWEQGVFCQPGGPLEAPRIHCARCPTGRRQRACVTQYQDGCAWVTSSGHMTWTHPTVTVHLIICLRAFHLPSDYDHTRLGFRWECALAQSLGLRWMPQGAGAACGMWIAVASRPCAVCWEGCRVWWLCCGWLCLCLQFPAPPVGCLGRCHSGYGIMPDWRGGGILGGIIGEGGFHGGCVFRSANLQLCGRTHSTL